MSHRASTSECRILVSVVMPCLNEASTLTSCIQEARAGCESLLLAKRADDDRIGPGINPEPKRQFEIIVADNDSSDGSREIAQAAGAKVVPIFVRGYGAALLGGIRAARGRYVVIGDSDRSYDFTEVPRFIAKLKDGYDLVVGNRFAGTIQPGAMPWHHRYVGNPALSGIGRFLFHPQCRDFHCGLRAFDRQKISSLGLRAQGMEFASEMIARSAMSGLRIGELPVTLRPDGRNRRPHLRSFRDGLRHLLLMLSLRLGQFV